MKPLILGDGLLGKTIIKKSKWDFISRKNNSIDFNDTKSYFFFLRKQYDTIINCIGYTQTYDIDRQKHWDTNYASVAQLVDFCNKEGRKLIHISTDYLYSGSNNFAKETDIPVHCPNWYGYTKLLADGYIQLKANDYLLIRTSFKKKPFPYPSAIIQSGNFDYVDKIAELIIKLIKKNATGVYNVGTSYKSMYDLAIKTKENIGINDKPIHPSMPQNVSMDITKMRKTLKTAI